MKKLKRFLSLALVLCLILSVVPFGTYAATVGTKPADGTVSGEPFDTNVSKNYRIPGLVNFNGTLIATADARWDYEKDGGGMDLVVSRSTNGGSSWNYTFAGYLGDNGNVWNADSTTLMDPVIITDGSKLYLLADMFPAGYSISSSSTANVFSDTAIGFDANGNLLLSKDNRSTYGYYLKDGKIYSTNGTEQSGYTVQGWYDLYQNGTYVTNLFFSDSPFQVRATSYICMTTSTDGVNWSDPTLLNVKPEGTSWMVLGPGSGLVTFDGNIAFTAYDGSNIYLIYGKDGSWNTVKTNAASNESSIIELNDGTIRAFVKRASSNTIAYVDFTKTSSGYTAGSLVSTSDANFSQCMVSSLHYSKTLNGKEVVLVCCPSDSAGGTWAGRFNGKIYVYTLDSNNAMTLAGSYQLNNSFFAYSNMAEMSDGSIAVLYEDDCISYSAGNYYGTASHITYTTVDLETALNITFDANVTKTDNDVSVTASGLTGLTVSETTPSVTIPGAINIKAWNVTPSTSAGSYSGSATVKVPVPSGWNTSKMGAYVVNSDGSYTLISGTYADGYYTYTCPHFSETGVYDVAVTATTTESVEVAINGTATKEQNGLSSQLTNSDVTIADSSIVSVNVTSTSTTTGGTTSYVRGDAASAISSGNKYVIASGNNALITSGTSFASGTLPASGAEVASTGMWTITASGSGYTISQVINGATYYLGCTRTNSGSSFGSTSYSYNLALTTNSTYATWIYSNGVFSQQLMTTDSWFGNDSDTTYYLSGSWSLSITSATVTLYNVNEQTISGTTTYDHTITFTGKKTGTTTVTLGNVTYNVTVKEIVYGDLFDNIIGTAVYRGDGSNTLDLTGKVVTALTTSVGSKFQLGTGVTDADSIVWESANTTVATVDENGVVTGVGEGETTVTVTVTKDGVVDTATIPVRVLPSFGTVTESNKTTVCYYIAEITNTIPYFTLYSDNVSLELATVVEGEVIYFERPNTVKFGMIWVAAPESGYALTYMAATNSEGQYFPLHGGDRTLETSNSNYYFASTACYNIYNSYGGNQQTIKTMLNKALAEPYLCDGAMSMGRRSTSDGETSPHLGSSLSFRSAKLPEVTKSVASVEGTPYTEGMVAQVGDVIIFNVTVKQFAAQDAITYSSDTLTENLSGAKFDSANGTTTKSVGLSDTALSTDTEYTYQVYYTVKASDLDTTITNTVNFTYSYQSTYSTGSMSASANAQAKITATTFSAKDLVIDFGLPVTVHYEPWGAPVALNTNKGDATYGTVSVSGSTTAGWDVTYTPNETLKGVDTVTIYGTNNAEYTFKVYPATTVYYEEGFASITSGWTAGSKGSGNQTAQILGSSSDEYGYDDAYDGSSKDAVSGIGASNGTQMSSTTAGSTATFTFIGTGIDVYANCNTGTGIVAVIIKDANGAIKKFYQVDTVMAAKEENPTDATSAQAVTAYSLPVVSVNGLEHGTYTVSLIHVSAVGGTKPVYIDGFRVYGTLEDEKTNSVYVADKEDNPEFYQLRDYVLYALGVDDSTSKDYKTMIDQVYSEVGDAVAVVLDNKSASDIYTDTDSKDTATAQDLLDNGPKNELFLYAGQSLVFSVKTSREMQIGLKAPNGAANVTITGATDEDKVLAIKSSTDMFYGLGNTTGTETTYTITITNNGSGILSITDLKICDDPNASFEALTAEDIELALKAMGYSDVTYADATLTVPVVDYTGKELTSVTLTANGVVGENAVFTAEEILAAVKEALPEGYGLVDESKVADVTVAYGESASASAQAGKTVTLTIKFISARNGKRVDTAEITVVQSSAKNWTRVSASQIKALAPEGYRAFWMINMTMVYGKDATIVVPVY